MFEIEGVPGKCIGLVPSFCFSFVLWQMTQIDDVQRATGFLGKHLYRVAINLGKIGAQCLVTARDLPQSLTQRIGVEVTLQMYRSWEVVSG